MRYWVWGEVERERKKSHSVRGGGLLLKKKGGKGGMKGEEGEGGRGGKKGSDILCIL